MRSVPLIFLPPPPPNPRDSALWVPTGYIFAETRTRKEENSNTQIWGWGGVKGYYLMGREFRFCKTKSSRDGWW